MYCHVMCDVKSHTLRSPLLCDVLLCDVKSHTTLRDVLSCDVKSLQQKSSVTWKIASQVPLITMVYGEYNWYQYFSCNGLWVVSWDLPSGYLTVRHGIDDPNRKRWFTELTSMVIFQIANCECHNQRVYPIIFPWNIPLNIPIDIPINHYIP